MSENINLEIPKKLIIASAVIVIGIFVLNLATGAITRKHLENEETMALSHKPGSQLYEQMVDELILDTKSLEHWERKIAAVELGHLGKGALRAVPDLERLLADDTQDVRTAAAIALAKVGSHSSKAVNALMEVLEYSSDHDKYLATQSLGIIGKGAEKAVPLLIMELKTGNTEVRKAARKALQKIGAPEALKAMK